MKTPKNIFPLSMLLISMILTGCADSTQNSNPKFSEATTTSAVTAPHPQLVPHLQQLTRHPLQCSR